MEQVYKRNDFIVKLFACLFIAIFLVFTFIGSRVFASCNFSYNDVTYQLPDEFEDYKYYIIYASGYGSDSDYYAMASNSQIYIQSTSCDYKLVFASPSQYLRNTGYYHNLNDLSNATYKVSIADSYYAGCYGTGGYSKSDFHIITSNYDVIDIDNDNVVFQAPPQEKEKVLAPIVEGEEMKPLQEILQILPIVMIVIIGYLALRKGLATLFRFLRTS